MQHAVVVAEALASGAPSGKSWGVVAKVIAAAVGGQLGQEPGLGLRLIAQLEAER